MTTWIEAVRTKGEVEAALDAARFDIAQLEGEVWSYPWMDLSRITEERLIKARDKATNPDDVISCNRMLEKLRAHVALVMLRCPGGGDWKPKPDLQARVAALSPEEVDAQLALRDLRWARVL